ncbi:unnamed protein product [Wuchereria bancrofti]|uniref:Uncharacterized protein n=1 Tax=Wuchereria bancrofti TaxID=6293 RepID=A0A3P7GCV1_WUCBA|nr:unnamed protein product [Wuchereria bancrofti]
MEFNRLQMANICHIGAESMVMEIGAEFMVTDKHSITVIIPPLSPLAPLIPVTVPRIHRIVDVYTLLTTLLCSWCYCEYSSSVDLTIGNVLFHS